MCVGGGGEGCGGGYSSRKSVLCFVVGGGGWQDQTTQLTKAISPEQSLGVVYSNNIMFPVFVLIYL